MWELRDWWCFSGEKCQFIEQLLVWVGGGIAGIKQNDISAAASASDDRHLIIIVCLLQKCAYTSLYIYFEGLKLLIFLKNTHRGEENKERKNHLSKSQVGQDERERDHHYYLHLKEKKHEISICYLDWLFIGDFRHSETMLGQPQRMYNQCKLSSVTKIFHFFKHTKFLVLFIKLVKSIERIHFFE